jgi:hypothetical protein
MFNKILKVLFITFCLAGVVYLALPNYAFPAPPPDSLQSQEPADTETPLRRAYFTNYDRAEVLAWYETQFEEKTILGIKLPAYLLNYPPEEAQTIIRDQTRSSFLQEVVHPMRESLYINGFEAKSNKDTILINDKLWHLKITVRYVTSNVIVREALFIGTAIMIAVVYNAFRKSLKRNGKKS